MSKEMFHIISIRLVSDRLISESIHELSKQFVKIGENCLFRLFDSLNENSNLNEHSSLNSIECTDFTDDYFAILKMKITQILCSILRSIQIF